jgi:hypothetical protein
MVYVEEDRAFDSLTVSSRVSLREHTSDDAEATVSYMVIAVLASPANDQRSDG